MKILTNLPSPSSYKLSPLARPGQARPTFYSTPLSRVQSGNGGSVICTLETNQDKLRPHLVIILRRTKTWLLLIVIN